MSCLLNKKRITPEVNAGIRASNVIVIGENNEKLGTMSKNDAIQYASDLELDLVKMSESNGIPVCRILDYKKRCFQQKKAKAELKKKNKSAEMKEIQLRPKIDTNDYQTKLSKAKKFLSSGNKLKLVLKFRGREKAHTTQAIQNVLNGFVNDLSDISKLDTQQSQEANNRASVILTPVVQKPITSKSSKSSLENINESFESDLNISANKNDGKKD